jgi:hypothetical protein
MRRLRTIAFASVLATAFVARADAPLPPPLQILGNVTNAARPVANALIIALNLKGLDSIQTYSALDGTFTLPPLPFGIYKIIAVKQGFVPAMATIIPTKTSQRVTLALENEKRAKKAKSDDMWEIRASVPPDVLRTIEMVLATDDDTRTTAPSFDIPRFKGQMVSMTGVGVGGDQQASPAFAQTSLGVESRLGDGWQIGIKGNLHRIEDPTDDAAFGQTAAQASVMSMELRSSPTDAYRIASTKSTWRYNNAGPSPADVRSHNFEWEHGQARVAVRYFAQENLLLTNPFNSQAIEITGGTTLMQTRRSDLGVSVRMTQENVRNTNTMTLRTADLTTNASFAMVPSFVVHYGLSSRVGVEGAEVAPRAGLEWKFGKDNEHAFVITAMHKAMENTHDAAVLPSVVVWSEDGRLLPRYSYSFGYVSGDPNETHFSAIATVTAVESPLRIVFNGDEQQFWDGLYIDSGDVRRDLRVSYRKDIGKWIAVDVSTSAGTATPEFTTVDVKKSYVTGDLQTIFFPTGTSIAISYLGIEQPQPLRGNYRSERVNVRMAQSLHLPVDLKVLLGLELAHAENSPFLLDTFDPATKKYIGGLAVNF